jgi:hypothetical protein
MAVLGGYGGYWKRYALTMGEVRGVESWYRKPVQYGIGFEYLCDVRNTVRGTRALAILSRQWFDVTTLGVFC